MKTIIIDLGDDQDPNNDDQVVPKTDPPTDDNIEPSEE